MATVITTTSSNPVGYPGQSFIDRDPRTNWLYMMAINSSSQWELRRSTDNGGSWSSFLVLSRGSVQELGPIFIDKDSWLHWCYRVNESSQDNVYYRRVNLKNVTPAWGPEVLAGSHSNGGSAGSVVTGMDMYPHRMYWGGYRIIIAVGYTSGSKHGCYVYGLSEQPNFVNLTSNHTIITGTKNWVFTGSGRIAPAIDVEHNGDARTTSSAHLWISFGRTALYMVKLSWNGSGWNSPSSAQTIRTGLGARNYQVGRWDRSRWCMAVPNPDDTTSVRIYQRNQANTATTTFDTPGHPNGVIRNIALTYDSADGDLRVYANGTSNTTVYYIDYSRVTATWTAWAQVSATAIVGTDAEEFGIRRGTFGNGKFDYYSTHATPSPNTVIHTAQAVSYVPSTPIWTTSGQPYVNGSAADVATTLTLDWVFQDQDPTDVQSAYALSRQIGAGALAYFRASDSTWQATEQKNLTATTQVTLAAAWATHTDAAYTYKVKVWDAADQPSVSYSDPLTLIPSTKVNPTIVTPTAAQVLGGDTVTSTWTVSEQTAFRFILATSGGIVVHDSNWVSSSALTYTPDYTMADGTAWTISFQTKNNEGLASNVVTRSFTVDYIEPPIPTMVLLPLPAQGIIRVTATNPAAIGSQPAVLKQELWRRPVSGLTPIVNANPTMAGNVTGWTANNGTLTYSTTQFRSSPGAARLVPPGGQAETRIESAKFVLTAGVSYEATAMVRADTALKPIFVQIMWYTIADVFISAATLVLTPPVATAWHFLRVTGDPSMVATAAKASVAAGVNGTPASTDAVYIDDVQLRVLNTDPGVRAADTLASNAVVDDWGPYALTDWEYRLVVTGVNNTTLYSAWQA